MQLVLHMQSTFKDMFCSTTAGYLSLSLRELHCAETSTSVSQLEAQLQAVSVEQF
jgi:hypothetical protein